MNYRACVFDAGSALKRVIPLFCQTDTDAVINLVKMGIGDFQKIAIWRGEKCIYSGRDLDLSALQDRNPNTAITLPFVFPLRWQKRRIRNERSDERQATPF
ncbi:MAG: hypothetical protein JWO50_889 [Candidatus Kaiserbacteria bacterium]|nr:hypothetical protein [Candidatus Kaiserbacteria bacterium]